MVALRYLRPVESRWSYIEGREGVAPESIAHGQSPVAMPLPIDTLPAFPDRISLTPVRPHLRTESSVPDQERHLDVPRDLVGHLRPHHAAKEAAPRPAHDDQIDLLLVHKVQNLTDRSLLPE